MKVYMADEIEQSAQSTTNTFTDKMKDVTDLPAELLREEIEQASQIYQIMLDFLTQYSFQLVGAIIIFIVGFALAGKISKVVLKLCKKKNIDITLSLFIASTTRFVMLIMVIIIVLSKIGISVTPFIAGIGAVSLGAAVMHVVARSEAQQLDAISRTLIAAATK